MVKDLFKYKFLIQQLVSRDIKIRYRRSFLGIFWSILNPLFFTLIVYVVFSSVFKSDIKNFPLYAIVGQIIFSFFSESTSSALNAIVDNASLIKKVYIPKYIFVVSRVVSSFVNLIFSLISLFVVMLITGTKINFSFLFLPFCFLYIFIFSVGISLILSSMNVFFRDIKHLYSILLTLLVYLTAIYYPIEIVPDSFRNILNYNPIYIFISYARNIVLYGISPNLTDNLLCCFLSFTVFIVGIKIFNKTENKFLFYI